MSMPVADTGHPEYAGYSSHDMQMRDELKASLTELEAILGKGSERQQSEQDEYDDLPENAADEHAGLGFRSVVLRNILLTQASIACLQGPLHHCRLQPSYRPGPEAKMLFQLYPRVPIS